MNKRLVQVDVDTGEIKEGFVAYIAPKRKNGFQKEGWLSMSQAAATLIAIDKDMSADDFRVLMALMGRLDFENLLVLNQAEMAREIGMHRQHVQRSIKRLMNKEVILEGPRIGVSRSYRFNPNFGWKGSAQNHVRAISDYRKERMKAARISGVVEGGRRAADAVEHDDKTLDLFDA